MMHLNIKRCKNASWAFQLPLSLQTPLQHQQKQSQQLVFLVFLRSRKHPVSQTQHLSPAPRTLCTFFHKNTHTQQTQHPNIKNHQHTASHNIPLRTTWKNIVLSVQPDSTGAAFYHYIQRIVPSHIAHNTHFYSTLRGWRSHNVARMQIMNDSRISATYRNRLILHTWQKHIFWMLQKSI